ncbi:hypothetical protein AC249_AIPGENE16308 [Exaiptasia diaphana]|nr:hypothetical protein AC249_AIPGENE16308 [Exaiptasia diaphana]
MIIGESEYFPPNIQYSCKIKNVGTYSLFVCLDETAVFGIACRHAFPWKFINLKGGDRCQLCTGSSAFIKDEQGNWFGQYQCKALEV